MIKYMNLEEQIDSDFSHRAGQGLAEHLVCLDFELTGEQLPRLDEVSKIELGFSYDFSSSESIRQLVYGGAFPALDPVRS